MITKQAHFDLSSRNTFRMRVKCALFVEVTEEAEYKFGFIINAFKFGAPPHGGLAFQGRDVMIDSPSQIDQAQLDELQIALNVKAE